MPHAAWRNGQTGTRWAILVPWASRAVGHAGTGLPRTPCVTAHNDCVDVQSEVAEPSTSTHWKRLVAGRKLRLFRSQPEPAQANAAFE